MCYSASVLASSTASGARSRSVLCCPTMDDAQRERKGPCLSWFPPLRPRLTVVKLESFRALERRAPSHVCMYAKYALGTALGSAPMDSLLAGPSWHWRQGMVVPVLRERERRHAAGLASGSNLRTRRSRLDCTTWRAVRSGKTAAASAAAHSNSHGQTFDGLRRLVNSVAPGMPRGTAAERYRTREMSGCLNHAEKPSVEALDAACSVVASSLVMEGAFRRHMEGCNGRTRTCCWHPLSSLVAGLRDPHSTLFLVVSKRGSR